MPLLRYLFIGMTGVAGFVIGNFVFGVLAALLLMAGIGLPPTLTAFLAPVAGLVGAGWLAMSVVS